MVTEDLVCACRQDTCPPQVGCWHVIRFLIWILRNIYAIVLKATKEFSKAVSKSKTLSETFFYGSHNSNSVKIPSGLVMIFKIMILIRLRYAVMMNAMMMNGHRYLYMFQRFKFARLSVLGLRWEFLFLCSIQHFFIFLV